MIAPFRTLSTADPLAGNGSTCRATSRRVERAKFENSAGRLRFTPLAWRKLIFFRDAGPTEIAAFGLAAKEDPLLVEDIALFRQRCTPATVRTLDDDSLADYVADRLDDGIPPSRATRIRIRTVHSQREIGQALDVAPALSYAARAPWEALLIASTVGPVVAQMQCGARRLPLAVSVPDVAAESLAVRAAWEREYARNVVRETLRVGPSGYFLPAHPRAFVPADRFETNRVRRSLSRRNTA